MSEYKLCEYKRYGTTGEWRPVEQDRVVKQLQAKVEEFEDAFLQEHQACVDALSKLDDAEKEIKNLELFQLKCQVFLGGRGLWDEFWKEAIKSEGGSNE